jgi:hypothetical protein
MADETHTRLPVAKPGVRHTDVVVRSGDELPVPEEAKPLPASD